MVFRSQIEVTQGFSFQLEPPRALPERPVFAARPFAALGGSCLDRWTDLGGPTPVGLVETNASPGVGVSSTGGNSPGSPGTGGHGGWWAPDFSMAGPVDGRMMVRKTTPWWVVFHFSIGSFCFFREPCFPKGIFWVWC